MNDAGWDHDQVPSGVTPFVWWAHRRGSLRALLGVALVVGLVGGLALASLAGARRTASTFAAYEDRNVLSHMAVNTFVPDLARVDAIAALPGVESSATYLGLDGYPVVDGEIIRDFRYTGLFGSYDGRFLTQDIATVVRGRLPRFDTADEIALTPGHAAHFGLDVGSEITYHFQTTDAEDSETVTDLGDTTYRVVGIVELPPVLVDENDIIQGAILPPAATAKRLDSFYYAWQGLRLDDGIGGIPALIERLKSDPSVNSLPPVVQRYDLTSAQVQRAVRPQAIALGLFGVAALIATLALGGQGIARLVNRWRTPTSLLRTLGVSRRSRVLLTSLDALLAIGTGCVLALVIAVAASPVAPVGAVRRVAPDTGFDVDATAALGGALLLAVLLTAGIVALAVEATRPTGRLRPVPPSRLANRAAAAGASAPVVVGVGFALHPGGPDQRGPVRGSLAAGAIALAAVVAAAVFGASLVHLITRPAEFGWVWDRMLIAEAGYGSLDRALVDEALAAEPDVTAASLVAFTDLPVGDVSVPAMGVEEVIPGIHFTINAGHAPASAGEIVLGALTMRTLHVGVGDRLTVTTPHGPKSLEVVGSMTFPTIGKGGADHPSLGRGALLTDDGLRALVSPGEACFESDEAICPQAMLLDLADAADDDAVVGRIIASDPDHTPGGTYEQPLSRGADIRNYDQMRRGPMALAALLAVSALAALGFALTSSVRSRRRELALLKALGVTRTGLQTTVLVQALVMAAVAVLVGVPLGLVAGRLAWRRFAESVGVPPFPTAPVVTLAAIAAGVLVACLLAGALPAAIAARTRVNEALRSE